MKKTIKMNIWLSLLGILFAGSLMANSFEEKISEKTINCQTSCVEITKIGHKFYVIVKDQSGITFDIIGLNLPENAQPLVSFKNTNNQSIQGDEGGTGAGDDGSSSTTTTTYRTTTEVITVTTILYFNASGQLIDIEVVEKRHPLNEMMK
ncbi:MAG: hypothetical protein COW84_05925 [Gammaproteobacteria bacterium CG22_combo_CG10-13_8_21_14_all_40_8]|nr:MAG: hypothetical protein COW84_05925 [Gammaproteobacteria bacterium CG22_combo_CG10-13_8_21_14_all_40_8]